jgi:uncharacterized protein (TIGR02646 family)
VIRINKPAQAPLILRDRGVRATRSLCQQYDADREPCKEWSFDSGLYGAKSVKNALQTAQHNKCAFCESKVSHVAYGDVEHFRPKAGYRQSPNDILVQPGYYWLAYEWSNLLFCCQLCNQRFKRNHFPLMDNGQRARSHHDEINGEHPLFINPAADVPSMFLEFREEYLIAIDSNPRGRATIEALGLNREQLVEMRRDLLGQIQLLITFRGVITNLLAVASNPILTEQLVLIDARLAQYKEDSAQYSAMARAALRVASAASNP